MFISFLNNLQFSAVYRESAAFSIAFDMFEIRQNFHIFGTNLKVYIGICLHMFRITGFRK